MKHLLLVAALGMAITVPALAKECVIMNPTGGVRTSSSPGIQDNKGPAIPNYTYVKIIATKWLGSGEYRILFVKVRFAGRTGWVSEVSCRGAGRF